MNTINIIGNLTRDPERRSTKNGTDIASFTIAAQRKYKNKETGNYDSDFIRCTAFRNQAEMICKYFQKGSKIGVTGSLHVETKKDESGNSRTYSEVWVDSVDFCDTLKKKEEKSPELDQFFGADLTPLPEEDLPF